jgi:hypothetical protein
MHIPSGDYATMKIKMEYLEFEDFTAVTKKNAVLWDVAPCRSCEN